MKAAGFKNVETAVVYREQEAPYFETMLATGRVGVRGQAD
jgi:hypothetical protein